jgi:hypothetical protein
MKNLKKMTIFLLSVLFASIILSPIIQNLEGFTGINTSTTGIYPRSVDKPILDDYPLANGNNNGNNNSNNNNDSLFKQTTNNLRYYKNPDNGSCTPSIFCNVLYKDKPNIKSNEITLLPPVKNGNGKRVGYFRENL